MSETLGETIRRVRLERGMSLADLARCAYTSRGYLSKVERNKQVPSDSLRAALANALGIELPAPTRSPYPGWVPTSDSVALVLTRQPDGSVIIVPMDRRVFLATAVTAAGAAALPTPDRVTPEVVSAMSDRLDWHIAAGRTTHPHTVAQLVAADLDSIVHAASDAPTALRGETFAIASRHAEYLGWMQQEAGDLDAAMQSTSYASDLARVAKWQPMVAYTTIRRARLWQYHRPGYAAELAATVYAHPSRLTPGLIAMAASQAAEAYARDGQDTSARRALDTAGRALGRLRPNEEPPIGPSVLTRDADLTAGMWQARCDLHLGQVERAIDPLHQLIESMGRPKTWALNGGQLAVAYAGAGAIDEAIATARRTLDESACCASATGARELRALRPALQPWAGRDDVDQVLAALPA